MKYSIPPSGLLTPPPASSEVYAAQPNAKRRMQGATPSSLKDTASDLRRRLEQYNDAKRFKN